MILSVTILTFLRRLIVTSNVNVIYSRQFLWALHMIRKDPAADSKHRKDVLCVTTRWGEVLLEAAALPHQGCEKLEGSPEGGS